jgi:hypothetical protein
MLFHRPEEKSAREKASDATDGADALKRRIGRGGGITFTQIGRSTKRVASKLSRSNFFLKHMKCWQ